METADNVNAEFKDQAQENLSAKATGERTFHGCHKGVSPKEGMQEREWQQQKKLSIYVKIIINVIELWWTIFP